MTVGGGVAPSVLETLEFPAALERVAAHAAGPLGAARVTRRFPATDPDAIRAALAQVAELAALLLSDDAIRAELVPDITAALELLGVPGSALEGAALAELGRALTAARTIAGDLARLATDAPRTAALRVDPPPQELEQRLAVSLDGDGQVQDGASRTLARARRSVREARARLVQKLDAMLAALDPTERAPDAAVTVREGRYVIPVRSTARCWPHPPTPAPRRGEGERWGHLPSPLSTKWRGGQGVRSSSRSISYSRPTSAPCWSRVRTPAARRC